MASPTLRLLAFIIDSLVYSILFITIILIFYFLNLFSKASLIFNNDTMDYLFVFFIIIFLFVLRWFYNVFLEFITNGSSIGKNIFKLRVIDIKGGYLTLSSIILRNFARIIDQSLTSYLGAFFAMVFDRYFRRIGDILAGCVVIREDRFNQELPDFSIKEKPLTFDKKILIKKLTEEELYILKKFLNSLDKWNENKKREMIIKMANKIKNRIKDQDEILDHLQYLKEVYMRHINE